MDLDTARTTIKRLLPRYYKLASEASTAERYYRNKNDILFMSRDDEKPLHSADNRICSSFYSLLVNQKAGYMFSTPPSFDTGSEENNKAFLNFLGAGFAKNCKDLCIRASNCGVAWLHYYEQDGKLKYTVMDGAGVIPIYNMGLERELIGALRIFNCTDDDSGKQYKVYQLWNDKMCESYRCDIGDTIDEGLLEYNMFKLEEILDNGLAESTNIYEHSFGQVPFIPFYNNGIETSDLENIKGLIDTYDKTYSGFANDLEDIQEIVMVLSGYEGEDLNEFLNELKRFKTIKLSGEEGSAVNTLAIDIPVEARDKLLSMTRKAIFEQGQGVDPNPNNFGNTSGVALKYLYSLLELKAGLAETEFRLGFAELAEAFFNYKGIRCENVKQLWTRTRIQNESEQAEIAEKSVGIIPGEIIVKNHPWVKEQ